MSELDGLKNKINQINANCQHMIQAGQFGANISDSIDELIKSSLDIISRLEKAEKAIPPPPKVEEPVEPPKTELKIPSPRKRKKPKY